MYVCLCLAITESDVRRRLRAGESITDLKRRTGAGDNCGSCNSQLRELARRYATPRDKR